MPWSLSKNIKLHEMKNEKKKTTCVFLYIKYGKFWSVSLERKPLISEECNLFLKHFWDRFVHFFKKKNVDFCLLWGNKWDFVSRILKHCATHITICSLKKNCNYVSFSVTLKWKWNWFQLIHKQGVGWRFFLKFFFQKPLRNLLTYFRYTFFVFFFTSLNVPRRFYGRFLKSIIFTIINWF